MFAFLIYAGSCFKLIISRSDIIPSCVVKVQQLINLVNAAIKLIRQQFNLNLTLECSWTAHV